MRLLRSSWSTTKVTIRHGSPLALVLLLPLEKLQQYIIFLTSKHVSRES